MKFEKLNENKIRIILSNQDLADKNIDFNSFMSNSAETQTLFLDMLEEAEEKVKALKEAIDKKDVEDINKKREELQEITYKLAAKVY